MTSISVDRLKRDWRALAAIMAVASVFGLSYSLAAPLIADRLAYRGFGPALIGLNAAMHALGVLVAAPVLPALAGRFGLRRLIVAVLAATAILFLLFCLPGGVGWWFVLRFGLGFAAETVFVLTESWTSMLSPEGSRGRIMALYTAVLSVGFAAGPGLLSVLPSGGPLPFLVGAGAVVLALLPMLLRLTPEPAEAADEERGSLLGSVRLAPLAMATTALNAALETAGLSFLGLYATGLGWTEAQGNRLVLVLMVGAILLQLPIGWLADRTDRRRLMLVLSVAASLGAFAWPVLLRSPVLAYPTLLLWGGIFVGIYTVMLAEIGSAFRGRALVGIYGGMGLFWGVGALAGPLLAGVAGSLSRNGLPWFAGLCCAIFAAALCIVGRTGGVPADGADID